MSIEWSQTMENLESRGIYEYHFQASKFMENSSFVW